MRCWQPERMQIKLVHVYSVFLTLSLFQVVEVHHETLEYILNVLLPFKHFLFYLLELPKFSSGNSQLFTLLHQLKKLVTSQFIERIPKILSHSASFLFTPDLSAPNAPISEVWSLHAFLKVHAFTMEPLITFIALNHKWILIKHTLSTNTVGQWIFNF